jgi:predicted ester cyclase
MDQAETVQANRRRFREGQRRVFGDARATAEALSDVYVRDTVWHGPHPLNDAVGLEALIDRHLRPLQRALPDLERCDDIIIGGTFKGCDWVAATGHLLGTFVAPWLGLPPTGKCLTIRYGEFARMADGKVVETYVIFDLLDVMRQAGCWPLAPSLGVTDRVPGPATHDGLIDAPQPAAETAKSLALVEAMIAGLMQYDGKTLESMAQTRFWHPKMMWYGPAGIGTARGLKGFQDHHQIPFLKAFPDRVGGDHKARLAEGRYVASCGWPSVRATHTGGDFLGLPATGRRIGQRVMDFWRREDDLLRENWVFIDLIDLLLQMGVDVFARLRVQRPDVT